MMVRIECPDSVLIRCTSHSFPLQIPFLFAGLGKITLVNWYFKAFLDSSLRHLFFYAFTPRIVNTKRERNNKESTRFVVVGWCIHVTRTCIDMYRTSLLIRWTLICGMALTSSASDVRTSDRHTHTHALHQPQRQQQQRPYGGEHGARDSSSLGLFRTPALPKPFINISYLPLDNVQQVSRFRSAIGHDFSDNTEHCR